MKIGTLLSVAGAFVGLFALSSPAQAQHHHGGGGGGGHMSGGGFSHSGNFHHGGGGFGHGGDFHHGGGHHGYYHGHSHVNFYFGGFGYPYYGDPYFGYPYSYGYGYSPYGYGYYSTATYTYDPQGVYQGRLVRHGDRQLSLTAQVQQQLAAAGYYHGDIDGIVGPQTRRAIRNYERANNLEVDGQIGDELLSTLRSG